MLELYKLATGYEAMPATPGRGPIEALTVVYGYVFAQQAGVVYIHIPEQGEWFDTRDGR